MVKEEWGIKRQCLSCGARFYDLKKNPIICIKCETVFVPEPLLKSRRWQGGESRTVAKKPPLEEKNTETKDETLEDGNEELEAGDGKVEDDGSTDTLLTDDDNDDDMSDVVQTPTKSEGNG